MRTPLSHVVGLTLALSSSTSLAAQASGPLTGAYLLQVAGSLLLVFGALFALLLWLRKVNGVSGTRSDGMRIVASTRLGTREKVVLLQAGEQQLLLGVAPGNVRTLHVLDKPLDMPSTNFAEVLAKRAQERSS